MKCGKNLHGFHFTAREAEIVLHNSTVEKEYFSLLESVDLHTLLPTVSFMPDSINNFLIFLDSSCMLLSAKTDFAISDPLIIEE